MRRAAKVDSSHAEIVAALRKAGCKVLSLAAVGSGCPDLLVLEPVLHLLILMEIKSPDQPKSKRKLNPLQVAWHAEWANAPIAVVETAEQALAAIGSQPAAQGCTT